MTPDQRIAVTPFPDGKRVRDKGRFTGWTSENDGKTIVLIQGSILSRDPLQIEDRVKRMVKTFPVLRDTFTVTKPHYAVDRPYARCTLPTVTGANEISRQLFHDMDVANIELVQTTDKDETPVREYVDYLMEGKLVASLDPSLYLHDIANHWIGGVTTQRSEFEVFRALGDETDAVGNQFGRDVQRNYVISLGRAFDIYSGFSPLFFMSERFSPDDTLTLTGECQDIIKRHCPQALDLSQQVINSPQLRTREDRNTAFEHYSAVAARLRQEPEALLTNAA